MAGRIIKVAVLVVLAAALSAPFASAEISTPASDQGMQVQAPTAADLNTPARDQGMQLDTTAAPNDRAGEQGIGQSSSDSIGMGGQYGQNLIEGEKAMNQRDVQNAKSFQLPLAPDDRPGTASVKPALVIPYLSHGVGVDASQFGGVASTPVSSTGDGFNWGTAGIGAAGLAALGLAIALVAVLARRGRNADVAVS